MFHIDDVFSSIREYLQTTQKDAPVVMEDILLRMNRAKGQEGPFDERYGAYIDQELSRRFHDAERTLQLDASLTKLTSRVPRFVRHLILDYDKKLLSKAALIQLAKDLPARHLEHINTLTIQNLSYTNLFRVIDLFAELLTPELQQFRFAFAFNQKGLTPERMERFADHITTLWSSSLEVIHLDFFTSQDFGYILQERLTAYSRLNEVICHGLVSHNADVVALLNRLPDTVRYITLSSSLNLDQWEDLLSTHPAAAQLQGIRDRSLPQDGIDLSSYPTLRSLECFEPHKRDLRTTYKPW